MVKLQVKVKLTVEQTTQGQRGSRGHDRYSTLHKNGTKHVEVPISYLLHFRCKGSCEMYSAV